jgi:carbonic anhydrase
MGRSGNRPPGSVIFVPGIRSCCLEASTFFYFRGSTVILFNRWIILATTLFGAVVPGVAFAKEASGSLDHQWGYVGERGPQHWGALNAEYAACTTGKSQAPIDIRGAVPADLEPIKFDYHPSQLKMIDNGHTIQVNYDAGSTITVGGQRYELVQFHFHKPSEEKIDGTGFPMVAHFVHRSPEGKLAVVAMLMKNGQANPFIETLWRNLPKIKGKEQVVEGVR